MITSMVKLWSEELKWKSGKGIGKGLNKMKNVNDDLLYEM